MASGYPFRVELEGVFHTGELYDKRGRQVFELERACEVADELYGRDWSAVYNGEEGIDRDAWIEQQAGKYVR